MTEQQLAPQGVENYQWRRGGFLDPVLLEPLYDINRTWLEVLANPVFGAATDPNPFEQIAMEVAQVEPALRISMAHCPFALFGARFHDSAHWMRIAGVYSVHDGAQGPYADALPKGKRREALVHFAQIAFFYGWHLVHLSPVAARLLLGIGDPVSAILKALSPARLHQLAREYPQTVAPRWVERPLFWPVLLNAAQKGESHFAQARLLGIQMVAADLMPTLGERRR